MPPTKKKKRAKAKAPQETVPEALASQVPFEAPRILGLDAVRNFLRRKAFSLEQRQVVVPRELVSDIDNVIAWLQDKPIRDVIKHYTRLAETVRYWRDYAKEEEQKVHRQFKREAAGLDVAIRTRLIAEKIKVTEGKVEAEVASSDKYQDLRELEAEWSFFVYQIQNLLDSMQTEILVQESVWTQKEDPRLGSSRPEV